MRKIILHLVITIFSLGFLIVFAGNIDASNNLFTVSPTINNITIDPGETLQKQLLVKNGGSQDINVTATVQKFSPTGSAGKINFSDSEGNSLISLSNNSSVIVTSISQTISSLATLQIPVSISAPKNVSPGGYYYSIIVKEVNKGSDVSVTPNIAALYFITVSGELKKSASIESFDIPLVNEDSTIEKVITLCEMISSIKSKILRNLIQLIK